MSATVIAFESDGDIVGLYLVDLSVVREHRPSESQSQKRDIPMFVL